MRGFTRRESGVKDDDHVFPENFTGGKQLEHKTKQSGRTYMYSIIVICACSVGAEKEDSGRESGTQLKSLFPDRLLTLNAAARKISRGGAVRRDSPLLGDSYDQLKLG